mmetsp:Transcript_12105/g.25039  ORF Transcript_12105/g.25039 Transcript_12105/m.25039 type:complete len:119 (-) Transcript_12105:215-571(-)
MISHSLSNCCAFASFLSCLSSLYHRQHFCRISRAFAPPVPTAEDYQQMMQQDVTAPPTAGGLYPTGGFAPSQAAPPADTAPPDGSMVFSSDSDGTTFRTEGSSGDSSETSKSSSWFSS